MSTRQAMHNRLDSDIPFFCRHLLKIKTKEGYIENFVMNKAQTYLHKKLEQQRADLGRVRAIIVKGRQQGCSTYIGARYYQKATRIRNKSVFILSHEADTTKKLFRMVDRYHALIPDTAKPRADIANRKEMEFKKINSDYCVGTAGNDNVGRGGTVQLFHGSEVAFWDKVDNIQTGVLESVAEMNDTEVILESTANGMGNAFYQMTMESIKGESDYQVIFIPWYWQDEYAREVPSDKKMGITEDEEEYRETIRKQKGEFAFELTDQQIYWRRSKKTTLKSDWMFKQEYPSSLLEAFQTTGETFIKAEAIVEARASKVEDKGAPLIMGVDPARTRDRTIISYRRGREFLPHDELTFDSNEETVQMIIAGNIARKIDELSPHKVFIDVGEGRGVVDRLKELGYGQIVQGIGFKTTPIDEDTYVNKRAEIWGLLRDFLHKEDGEVSIPDSDEVQLDLSCMPKAIIQSSGKTQLVAKDKIRKDNSGLSPDIGDAMALTFSFPVRRSNSKQSNINKFTRKRAKESSLSTINRIRRYNKNYGSTNFRR